VNKKTLCNHASQNWNQIKEDLSQKCDSTKTVRMQHFVKVKSTTKKGKEVTKLVASATDGNMLFILDFIDQLLAKMIHHRNHLHHYRYAIHKMRENVEPSILGLLNYQLDINRTTRMYQMIGNMTDISLKSASRRCWKYQKFKLFRCPIY